MTDAPDPSRSAPAVVCIGSAALDMLVEVDVLPTDDGRVAATDGSLAGGGPAATAAVALARLGIPTGLIAGIGDDASGRLIVDGLRDAGVGTRWVAPLPGSRSALSVGIIRSGRPPTRSLVALAADGASTGIPADAVEACRRATWIHVDQAGWPMVRWLRDNGVRTPVSVDGGNPLVDLDLSLVDLYVPSEAELRRWTGCSDGPRAMAEAVRLGAPMVVATRGEQGSRYLGLRDPDEPWYPSATPRAGMATQTWTLDMAAHPIEARSTLGAGDVYHGALLAALVRGASIRAAMRYASVVAALSCRALDGRSAIPTHEDVVSIAAGNGDPPAARLIDA